MPLSDTNFNKELDTLKYITLVNGYPLEYFNKLFSRYEKKRSFQNNCVTVVPDKKKESTYASLNFINCHLATDLKRVFSKLNIEISFRTKANILCLFNNGKDKIDKADMSGVYRLNCLECPAFYIGQSGRKISVRMSEHIRKVLNHKDSDSNNTT